MGSVSLKVRTDQSEYTCLAKLSYNTENGKSSNIVANVRHNLNNKFQ